MHARVQRLHAAVEHLGKTGQFADVFDRQAGFAKRLCRAAGRNQLYTEARERLCKLHEPAFVGHAQQRAANRLRAISIAPVPVASISDFNSLLIRLSCRNPRANLHCPHDRRRSAKTKSRLHWKASRICGRTEPALMTPLQCRIAIVRNLHRLLKSECFRVVIWVVIPRPPQPEILPPRAIAPPPPRRRRPAWAAAPATYLLLESIAPYFLRWWRAGSSFWMPTPTS